LIVVTAGHVDHGKTSLVQNLTGTDTDRLPEEKKRGMSIDLGFAYLAHAFADGAGADTGGSETAGDRQIAFVDVPGHEKFVRNMIAGVSAVDIALLVIAADDGPMPQTREHLAILQLLQVPQLIVAISKADLVDPQRLAEARLEITELLAHTEFANAQMIDTSIHDPASTERVKSALIDCLSMQQVPEPDDTTYFRMCVDRRFSVTGAGTVVTGTVSSGVVSVDQEVYVLAGQVPLRVRGIRAQSEQATRAVAGQRCALNLAGGDLKRAQLQRGEWITGSAMHRPVRYFDVSVSPSEPGTLLKHWTPAHCHVGAADIPCRIALLNAEQLAYGETGYARLLCDRDVGVVHGDRFVLRDQSARHTIAGGAVIDPLPPRRGRSRPERLAVLDAMHQPTSAQALQQLIAMQPAGVSINEFSLQFNVRPDAVSALVDGRDDVVCTKPAADAWLLYQTHWQSLLETLQQSLQAWHEKNTEALGADAEQLRRQLSLRVARPVLLDALAHLCKDGVLVRRGAVYRVAGHSTSLGAELEQRWAQLQPLYNDVSPVAPRVVELAEAFDMTAPEVLTMLNRFVAHGRMYRVSENRYFLPADLLKLARIAEQLAEAETLTVAEYRDKSGIGRNLVVELLEFFDRVQMTRRLGQFRTMLRAADEVFEE
jgi:selenocysteine-specific elongation factor